MGSIDCLEFFAVGIGHTIVAISWLEVYHKGHRANQRVLP
jgi:hypothetical protein